MIRRTEKKKRIKNTNVVEIGKEKFNIEKSEFGGKEKRKKPNEKTQKRLNRKINKGRFFLFIYCFKFNIKIGRNPTSPLDKMLALMVYYC
ncbi:MAG: hypothetical protein Q8P10_00795 [bacterium]|nr:hypothetical protein [bacterium]